MGSWDARQSTAGGTVNVAGTAALLLSAVSLLLFARSVVQFFQPVSVMSPHKAEVRVWKRGRCSKTGFGKTQKQQISLRV